MGKVKKCITLLLTIAMAITAIPSEMTYMVANAEENTITHMSHQSNGWKIYLNDKPIFCLNAGKKCSPGDVYSSTQSKDDITVPGKTIEDWIKGGTLNYDQFCAVVGRAWDDNKIDYFTVRNFLRNATSKNNYTTACKNLVKDYITWTEVGHTRTYDATDVQFYTRDTVDSNGNEDYTYAANGNHFSYLKDNQIDTFTINTNGKYISKIKKRCWKRSDSNPTGVDLKESYSNIQSNFSPIQNESSKGQYKSPDHNFFYYDNSNHDYYVCTHGEKDNDGYYTYSCKTKTNETKYPNYYKQNDIETGYHIDTDYTRLPSSVEYNGNYDKDDLNYKADGGNYNLVCNAITNGHWEKYTQGKSFAQTLMTVGGNNRKISTNVVTMTGYAKQKLKIVKKNNDGYAMPNAKFTIRFKANFDDDANEQLYKVYLNDANGENTLDPDDDSTSGDDTPFRIQENDNIVRIAGKTDENGCFAVSFTYAYESDEFSYTSGDNDSKKTAKQHAKDDVCTWMENFHDKTYYIQEKNSGNSNIAINPDYAIKDNQKITDLAVGTKVTISRDQTNGENGGGTAFTLNPRQKDGTFSDKGWEWCSDEDLKKNHWFDASDINTTYTTTEQLTDNNKFTQVNIHKSNAETNISGNLSLAGAVFGLYNDAGEKVEDAKTDQQGNANFTSNIYAGKNYTIKEISAPAGFYISTEIKNISWNANDATSTTAKCENQIAIQNFDEQPKKTNFKVEKTQKGTTERPEQGAEFTYYLVNNDGSVSKIGVLTTDVNGVTGNTIDLGQGLYMIEQTKAGNNGSDDVILKDKRYVHIYDKNGGNSPLAIYKSDENKNHLEENPMKNNVYSFTKDDPDRKYSYPLKIYKMDAQTKKAILKTGNQFRLYRMNMHKDIMYTTEYTEAKMASNGQMVKCKPISDNKGNYILEADSKTGVVDLSEPLEYGRYLIEEVGTSKGNYIIKSSMEVNVRSFQCDENDNVIYDTNGNKIANDLYKTLPDGTQVIYVEYVNGDKYGKFTLKKTGEALDAFHYSWTNDENLGIPDVNTLISNLSSFVSEGFTYKNVNLAGAKFKVTAVDDIISQDGQGTVYAKAGETIATITTGNDAADYSIKENVADEAKPLFNYDLNADYSITMTMPLGKYQVEEITSPYGYLMPSNNKWELNFDDNNAKDSMSNPIVLSNENVDDSGTLAVVNNIAKAKLKLVKTDSIDASLPVSGCAFGLYSSDDIYNAEGLKIVKKDQLIDIVSTNENGCASSDKKLPIKSEAYGIAEKTNSGKYYWKELKSNGSYYINTTKKEIEADYKDSSTAVIEISSQFKDTPTDVYIQKLKSDSMPVTPTAISTSTAVDAKNESLEGCKLQLTDKEGNIIATWTTGNASSTKLTDKAVKLGYNNFRQEYVSNKLHLIGLIRGMEYTITELHPADGWTTADPVKFIVPETENAPLQLIWKSKPVSVQGKTINMFDIPTKVKCKKTDITGEKEIPGCKLSVIASSGAVVDNWTSTDAAHDIIGKLIVGETYTLHEIRPADGYVTAADVKFSVKDTGDVQKVTMKDDTTKVKFDKVALTGEKEIPGCKLSVIASSGAVVDNWTSTDAAHEIIGKLVVGETYTLHEIRPADGYVTAADVTFRIKDTGDVQKVVMKDDTTKIKCNKTDMTGEKEIPGCKLSVIASSGAVVDNWTSTDAAHEIIGKLVVGETYTLHEIRPADGYVTAADVTFQIKDTGDVQKVVMKDDTTKIKFKKIASDTKMQLAGAKFDVYNSKNKKVMTFITNNKPVYFINKLIVGEIYKFKEVTAPENYQKAKTITIKIKNTGDIQVISVEDKRSPGKITTDTPSGFPEGNNGSPHTGFDNALNFLIGTLMLSGAGIVWTLWRKKKLCK